MEPLLRKRVLLSEEVNGPLKKRLMLIASLWNLKLGFCH
jgi:hypothetical protein